MLEAIIQLGMFAAKAIIVLAFILILLAGIISLISRGKHRDQLSIKDLNSGYFETKQDLLQKILPKKEFKKFLKQHKADEKNKLAKSAESPEKKVFVLNFNGDIRASAVAALREEVTAILNIATIQDEVVVRLESPGGMVHGYGLAAAQLVRIRDRGISLTVTVDKVAASGGYLMACVANKIIAAPFALIGSIGVIVQLPNFHRFLKDKNIDFEQLTAGSYKRTLTMFGENTEAGREKLHQEIEEIHGLFKNLIIEHRPQLDIEKVSTGEHWLAKQAITLRLVDELKTSDDYLLEKSKVAAVYEVSYHIKKSLSERLLASSGSANVVQRGLIWRVVAGFQRWIS